MLENTMLFDSQYLSAVNDHTSSDQKGEKMFLALVDLKSEI